MQKGLTHPPRLRTSKPCQNDSDRVYSLCKMTLGSPSFVYYFSVIYVKHQSVYRRTHHIGNECAIYIP